MASVIRNARRQRRALDLDIRIGINIRARRMMLGLNSTAACGGAIDLEDGSANPPSMECEH